MNHHSWRVLQATLVAIASSFIWTLQAFSASAPAKYVVGYATYTARIVPLWLAQEQGFFTKYGIDVDPVFIRGAPAAAQFWPRFLRDMTSKSSPRLTAATPKISWSERTSREPKSCVAKRSRSPASGGGRAGWVSCFGLNIWAWTNSATTFACR